MKIGIVGLGLIGGSYAKALKPFQHELIGYDINPHTIEYAIKNNIVDKAYLDTTHELSSCDVVFICLYPQDTINYIHQHQTMFKKGAIISDVAGVKEHLMNQCLDHSQPFEIVFAHPIAGRETSGIDSSKYGLFQEMNFIITPHQYNTEKGINTIQSLAKAMGFKHISLMSAKEHDQTIGYTSQLTHVIALSLVNASDYRENTKFAIGDSYKDLTRIARMNENLWSELFLSNHDHLLDIIEHFEQSLHAVKTAIKQNDAKTLKQLMRQSTKRRSDLDD